MRLGVAPVLFRCSDLDWRWLGGVSTRGRIAGAVRVAARSPIGFDVSCPVGMLLVSAVGVAPTLRSPAGRAARRAQGGSATRRCARP